MVPLRFPLGGASGWPCVAGVWGWGRGRRSTWRRRRSGSRRERRARTALGRYICTSRSRGRCGCWGRPPSAAAPRDRPMARGSRCGISGAADEVHLVVLRASDGAEIGRVSLADRIDDNPFLSYPRDISPLWSPDGTRLAALTQGAVYVFDRDAVLLSEFRLEEPPGSSYGLAAAWSPDSEFLFGFFEDRAVVVDRD